MTIAITPTAASRLREHFEQLQRPDARPRCVGQQCPSATAALRVAGTFGSSRTDRAH